VQLAGLMLEQAHLQGIQERINGFEQQLAYATSDRLKRTLIGLITNEKSRLLQYERLVEIRTSDGE